MSERHHIYFASDFHLGLDLGLSSEERETIIIEWLESILPNAKVLYLIGDVFDYWYEYKSVVPKGYFRLFSFLHHMVKSGVEVHYFHGNHDMWHFRYLEESIGIHMHAGPFITKHGKHTFYISHGDEVDSEDRSYIWAKKIMTNRWCQALFGLLHPDIGLSLMKKLSLLSRNQHHSSSDAVSGNAIPIRFCENYLAGNTHIDFFIMGHWHEPVIHPLSHDNSIYCNSGDWMTYFSYVVYDGDKLELNRWSAAATHTKQDYI